MQFLLYTVFLQHKRLPRSYLKLYFLFSLHQAVFKVYDLDKDGSINQDEFQSIATNFPFMDDFTMLDTNWYVKGITLFFSICSVHFSLPDDGRQIPTEMLPHLICRACPDWW